MPGNPPKNLFYVIMFDDDMTNKPDRYVFRKCDENKARVVTETQYDDTEIDEPRSKYASFDVTHIQSRTYTHVVTGFKEKGAVYEFKKQ